MSSAAIAKRALRRLTRQLAQAVVLGFALAGAFAISRVVAGGNSLVALFLVVMPLWFAFCLAYIRVRFPMVDVGMEVERDG